MIRDIIEGGKKCPRKGIGQRGMNRKFGQLSLLCFCQGAEGEVVVPEAGHAGRIHMIGWHIQPSHGGAGW